MDAGLGAIRLDFARPKRRCERFDRSKYHSPAVRLRGATSSERYPANRNQVATKQAHSIRLPSRRFRYNRRMGPPSHSRTPLGSITASRRSISLRGQ
jgi:hypothetical protein